MKPHDVLLKAMPKRISWEPRRRSLDQRSNDAAMASAVGATRLRRADGPAQRECPFASGGSEDSGTSAPALREKYYDLKMHHFREKLSQEQIHLSCTWAQKALQEVAEIHPLLLEISTAIPLDLH